MIIWSSINCPTVICSPTVCYFSWEKPPVKPTPPGSLSHIFALRSTFSWRLFSDLLNQKIQKYLAAIYSYLFYLAFDLSIYYNFIHVCLPILRRRYPKGIVNPFYTSGCEYLLFVCRCCLHCVAWFSYWFDNLGLITEGNTYRPCAASSLPLWGNTDVVLADRNFLAPLLGSHQKEFMAPLPIRDWQPL